MNETAHLQIRVSDSGVDRATDSLRRLERQSGRTEGATGRLGAAAARALAPVAALVSVGAGLNKFIAVARQFDVLNAQLITATGSAENARIAFQALEDFAQNTPYQLDEVTKSFTKLVNMGLTPSERALTSYGDTASSMSRSMDQMIEAVADAATGEFERLKEFGIRASKQGEQVTFTFRGVKETVEFNAKAIEEYMIRLGEVNFAGGMQRRMETLDGAISNLSDQWDALFRNIAEAGTGDAMEGMVRDVIGALEEANAMVASGQATQFIDVFMLKIDALVDTAELGFGFIPDLLKRATDSMGGDWDAALDWMADALWNLPENVRAMARIIIAEFQAMVSRVGAYFGTLTTNASIEFDRIGDKAAALGSEIVDSLNPFDGDSFNMYDEWIKIDNRATEQFTANGEKLQESLKRINDKRFESIEVALSERDVTLDAQQQAIEKSQALRKAYDEELAARRANTQDRLAQFGVDKPSEGKGGSGNTSESSAVKKARNDFERVTEYLRTEEESIKASYDRRREIILNNTAETSLAREEMLARLDEKYAEENASLQESRMRELEALRESLYTEEQAIQASYEERRRIILENTQITGEQKRQLMEQIEQDRVSQLNKLEATRQRETLRSTSDFLGNLAMLQQSNSSKMASIGKAAAIAQATIKTYESATSAYSAMAGIPVVGPSLGAAAAAAAVAAGLANVAAIKSTSYAGAYDQGGHIPAGQIGLVGEIGPELVRGPANVTGREDTAGLLGKGGGDVHLAIQTYVTVQGGGMDRDGAQRMGDSLNDRVEFSVMQLLHREMQPNGVLDRWKAS